jgi:hypothetical protein
MPMTHAPTATLRLCRPLLAGAAAGLARVLRLSPDPQARCLHS